MSARRRENVAVEARVAERDALLAKELRQVSLQFAAGVLRHAAANPHGEMVGTGKRPDVSLQAAHKFHLNGVRTAGNEVAQGDFQVLGRKGARVGEENVARARRQNQEIGLVRGAFGGERRRFSADIHRSDMRTDHATSRACGTVEQKAVEYRARVDDDGVIERQQSAIAMARNQLDAVNRFFGVRTVEQEGIAAHGLMGEAAAAGLLPGEMLIKKGDLKAGRGEPLRAKSAGRTAAHDGDTLPGHGFGRDSFGPKGVGRAMKSMEMNTIWNRPPSDPPVSESRIRM